MSISFFKFFNIFTVVISKLYSGGGMSPTGGGGGSQGGTNPMGIIRSRQ